MKCYWRQNNIYGFSSDKDPKSCIILIIIILSYRILQIKIQPVTVISFLTTFMQKKTFKYANFCNSGNFHNQISYLILRRRKAGVFPLFDNPCLLI